MFIFFACPKKTNQKKGHPATCPPPADSLCSSKLPGSKKLARLWRTQTAFDPFSAAFPVLGGVPMGKTSKFKS